jgi:nucleoside phosphorylase
MTDIHQSSVQPTSPPPSPRPLHVAILCATAQECREARGVFSRGALSAGHGPMVQKVFEGAAYHSVSLVDEMKAELVVDLFSWDVMGSLKAQHFTERVLDREVDCRWLFMTGVCAGNPLKGVHPGDVLVARRVMDLTQGKVDGAGFHPQIKAFDISDNLSGFIELTFDSLRERLSEDAQLQGLIQCARPISLRQRKAELEEQLYRLQRSNDSQTDQDQDTRPPSPGVGTHPTPPRGAVGVTKQQLAAALPWLSSEPDVLKALLNQCEPSVTRTFAQDNTSLYRLSSAAFTRLDRLYKDDEPLTEMDPATPGFHFGPVGTDPSRIRANISPQDFEQMSLDVADRTLLGLEMEGTGVYAAVAQRRELHGRGPHCILVKGVSDLANADKDDRFHVYGKQLSAAFVYQFLVQHGSQAAAASHSHSHSHPIPSLTHSTGKSLEAVALV